MMCGIRILNIPCKGMSMRVVLVLSRPFRSVIILNPYKLCGGRKIPGNGPRRVKLKSSRDPIPSVKSLICIVKDRHNPIMRLLKHPAPDGRSGCGRKIPWNILMRLSSNHIPLVIKVLSVEPIRCGGNKEREKGHPCVDAADSESDFVGETSIFLCPVDVSVSLGRCCLLLLLSLLLNRVSKRPISRWHRFPFTRHTHPSFTF